MGESSGATDTELDKKFRRELHSGTIALAVMGLLVQSRKPMYGYEIGQHLLQFSDDENGVNQGTLYPVLRSLEKSGLLHSQTEPSVSGPPRKYYAPTPLGRSTFKSWKQIWQQTRRWVDHVLDPKHDSHKSVSPRHS